MVTYVILGFTGVVLTLIGVVYWQNRPEKPDEEIIEVEPEYLQEVRELAEAERFREAAELQLHHGNIPEAFNLFMRGKCHSDASALAETLDWPEKAAFHAEQANEFDRAALMYEKSGNLKMAGRMFAQAGLLQQAIRAMDSLPGGAPDDLPEIWEQALINLLGSLPAPPSKLTPTTEHKIERLADLASSAYRDAGNIERSYMIHSLVEKEQQARRRAENKANGEGSVERESIRGDDYGTGVAHPNALFPQQHMQPMVPAGAILGPMMAPQSTMVPMAPGQPTGAPLMQPTGAPLIQPGVPMMQPTGVPMSSAHIPMVANPGTSGTGFMMQATIAPGHGGQQVVVMQGGTAAGMSQTGGPSGSAFPENERMHELMSAHESQFQSAPQPFATGAAPVVYVMDAYTQVPQAVRKTSDRYTLGPKIASGGMAVVYEAIDNLENRKVAIKFLPPSLSASEQALEMFAREAKIASGLNHPNIVAVYDYGVLDSCPYICMELLDGITLQELMQRRWTQGLPLEDVFAIGDELLAALDYAHSRNLVHRDIKPSNIMCTREGVIKLMDFGVARQMDTTGSVTVAGTPSYMSPEQVRGRGLDHRTDLFSFGVTLYLLLTGEMPFEGFMRDIVPRSPMEFRKMPSALAQVVMWCMSFLQEERPESASILQQILQRIYLDVYDEWLSEVPQASRQNTFVLQAKSSELLDEVESLEIATPWDQGDEEITESSPSLMEAADPALFWLDPYEESEHTVAHPFQDAGSLERTPMELVESLPGQEPEPLLAPGSGEAQSISTPLRADGSNSTTRGSSDSLEQLLAGYLTEE